MPITDVTSLSKPAWNPSRIVVWLFVLIALTLNIATPPLNDWLVSWIDEEILYLGMIGTVSGEFCVVVLLSGLASHTWLRGFLHGLSMAFVWYLALMVGCWLAVEKPDIPPLYIACVIPWYLLAASAPLIALRHCGWRLIHHTDVVAWSPPFRIADLFHGTAMVAATLTLFRVPAVVSETDPSDYWPPMLIVSAIFFAVGLLCMPVAVRLTFGVSSRAKSVVGFGLLTAIVYVAICLIAQFFYRWDATWELRSEVLLPIASAVGACAAVLYAFTFFFSLSGFVLVRERPRVPSTQDVNESNQEVKSSKRRLLSSGRWQTVVAIGVAAIATISLATLQSWRQAKDLEIARLEKIAQKLGGTVGSHDREVTRISLGQQATDADIEFFLNCGLLQSLRLDSKNITDRTLERIAKCGSLTSLSFNGAAITDQGLSHLSNLKTLTDLKLINTTITGAGLRQLVDSVPITRLDLERTRISDADCTIFPQFWRLDGLTLSGTAVTDKGVRHLDKNQNLQLLTLNDTTIDGTGLHECRSLQILFLDRTRVNDESIRSLASLSNLRLLSIADTRITDQTMDQFVQFPILANLDISHTEISDAGVARLASLASLQFLHLSGTTITGVCFRKWPIAQLEYLDASNTLVTDATLPFVAKLGLKRLSVRGTKVTTTGILTAGFAGLETLDVGPGQFSEAEMERLKLGLSANVQVRTGEEPKVE